MSKKVEITADARVRVLTFQGMEAEYYQEVPEAWVECFGAENSENPKALAFNRILYLRNVNIRPVAAEVMKMFLPIWHAAVITFMDDTPVTILLISEATLMDKLIRTHHPIEVIKMLYPQVKADEIQVDLIDAEEADITNEASDQFPSIVLEGWPKEDWRASYQEMKTIVESTGEGGHLDFDYSLEIEDVSVQLHFLYLIINADQEEFLWIHYDEIRPIGKDILYI